MRRLLHVTLLSMMLCIGSAVPAIAQDFPNKPIRLVVGFPPGGSTDIIARIVAARLRETLGQPVIIENRPGADGIVAANMVIKAPADGYTLMIGTTSVMTVNPVLYDTLSYDPLKDFDPVSLIGLVPVVIAVQPSLPITNTKELIEYAKANPGKLDYAAAAPAHTLATELFKQMTGTDFNHIPYKGSAQAVAALLAGDVQLTFVDSPAIMSHVKAGKLRGLAVSTAQRVATLPELPTVAEQGIPGFDVSLWMGFSAPAGTPAAIIIRLSEEFAKVAKDRDVIAQLEAGGGVPVGSTPAQFREFIVSETDRWRKLVQERGIALNE